MSAATRDRNGDGPRAADAPLPGPEPGPLPASFVGRVLDALDASAARWPDGVGVNALGYLLHGDYRKGHYARTARALAVLVARGEAVALAAAPGKQAPRYRSAEAAASGVPGVRRKRLRESRP